MANTKKALAERRDSHRTMTLARKEAFIRAYESCGIFSHAAKAASPGATGPGDCASSFRSAMESDPIFRARVEEAKQTFDDTLIAEAVRRARDGVPRRIYQKGEQVFNKDGSEALVYEYSDNLLGRLLEARVRDFVRKREVEVTGSINHAHVGLLLTPGDLAALDNSEKEALGRILRKIGIHRGELPAPESDHDSGKQRQALPAPANAPIDAAFAEIDPQIEAELAALEEIL